MCIEMFEVDVYEYGCERVTDYTLHNDEMMEIEDYAKEHNLTHVGNHIYYSEGYVYWQPRNWILGECSIKPVLRVKVSPEKQKKIEGGIEINQI